MRRSFSFGVALLGLLPGVPALAASVSVDVKISYTPPSPSELPPGSPDFDTLTLADGVITLFSNQAVGPPAPLVPPGPTTISPLSAGDSFSIVFHPPQPCLPAGACQLDFSFSALTGAFPTFAFAAGAPPPSTIPPGPNVIPVGVLVPPGPTTVTASGDLVAFDMPVAVGAWSATMTDVPEPSPAALIAVGLAGLIGLSRLRLARAKAA